MIAIVRAATDYPLLNLFWTMLWFFLFVAWIWLLIIILADVFRSEDLGGWSKALWVIFIVILPWLGVLVYLIARGGKMHERAAADAARRDQAMRSYIRDAAGPTSGAGTSSVDELAKLAQLRDSGAISSAEYDTLKAKVVAS